jgi:lipopolysaccharide/colanic/teichoic acid biosynthesis glycosyltransferase
MLIVGLIIRINLGSPILFKQKRIGKNNKEFFLIKFRSMTNTKDTNGVYLPDDQRVTKFGKFIRITSIDELPSIINVLNGDMSLIGPRPLPIRYLNRFTDIQKKRHDVRPGLSSLSTAYGRNSQTWEEQFEGDLWYVNNVSFIIDLKSIFATIKVVFTQKGATSIDGGARSEFIGIAKIDDLHNDDEGNYIKLKQNF